MAKKTKFKWLRPNEFPRQGPPLVNGRVYDCSEFPAHVVEEWVDTGAARMVKDKEEAEAESSEPTAGPLTGGENGNTNDTPKKTTRRRSG